MSSLNKLSSHFFMKPNEKKFYFKFKNCKRRICTSRPLEAIERTFNKVLIANRGEIACRIIKTAKKMGIKTVAVFSVADTSSKYVKLADEAVYIGQPTATESYLNIAKIMDAIKTTGADAVHPGYGFLSENPKFVEMLENKNISFIGPSAKVMRGMGDKLESKRLAKTAGVNIIPGYDGIIEDEDHCINIARDIGYPVMIKASAGGGGKGMRIAYNDNDAREGYKLSTQEAVSSFGDGRMLVEKYIENPRHIEMQVLGDKSGNAIYLNERECSIQRRNQKIIEEAPSTFLDAVTRKHMGEQAVNLCKKLGYYSAGTVEFLVDADKKFYFLEMNTRLQVEHPVTECITGIDIVEQMIRVAKGNDLNIRQGDVKIQGWAIESRVYAEDPYKQFGLPNIGRLYKYVEPKGINVRCDSGIEEGSEISIYYDPMISKLVCHGENRNEAIEKSIKALDNYVIRGVKHNIPLLRDIFTEKHFLNGDIDTNYLNKIYKDGFKTTPLKSVDKYRLLAASAAIHAARDQKSREYLNGPKILIHAKNLEVWDLVLELNNEKFKANVRQTNGSFQVTIDDQIFNIPKKLNLSTPVLNLEIDNETFVTQLISKSANGNYQIIYQGCVHNINILTKTANDLLLLMPKKSKKSGSKINKLKAPMSGLVKNVSCMEGDSINEGDEICIIEAMKMQNSMTSNFAGIIKNVMIKEGDTIGEGDVLVVLE